VSNDERNEYIRGVKWATGFWVIGSLATILLSLSAAYHGLESAIKDSKAYSKELFVRTDRKIDSLHSEDKLQIQSLKDAIDGIEQTYSKPKKSNQSLYTERWINGKLTFVKL